MILTVTVEMWADSVWVTTGFHIGSRLRRRSKDAAAAAHSTLSPFTLSVFHRQTITKQTNMASSDTDDDIIISSALLIVSTLYQSRQVSVTKHKRNSWARKQTIDQSQLGDRASNCRRIEMVTIKQFSCSTRQKLGNLWCQTGNFDEQQSCVTKLLYFVACLTWAFICRTWQKNHKTEKSLKLKIPFQTRWTKAEEELDSVIATTTAVITAAFRHLNTAAFRHFITAAFRHLNTAVFRHLITAAFTRLNTAAFRRLNTGAFRPVSCLQYTVENLHRQTTQ